MTEVGKVIVSYDGSERGQDALALGVALATVTRATLIVARAFAGPPLRAELASVASSIEGVDVEPCALSGDSPAKALYGLAVESPDAIVVLGSSHRGAFGQVMPGSVVEPMLHGSPRPVAVAPRGLARSDYSLRVLGAAFDDSAEARIALELAGELALRSRRDGPGDRGAQRQRAGRGRWPGTAGRLRRPCGSPRRDPRRGGRSPE